MRCDNIVNIKEAQTPKSTTRHLSFKQEEFMEKLGIPAHGTIIDLKSKQDPVTFKIKYFVDSERFEDSYEMSMKKIAKAFDVAGAEIQALYTVHDRSKVLERMEMKVKTKVEKNAWWKRIKSAHNMKKDNIF